MESTESLTELQRADIGRLLRERRADLERLIDRELHRDDAETIQATRYADDDRMGSHEDEMVLAKLERDTREIEAINRALQRLAGAEFGQCEVCGAAIGYTRLIAHPIAMRCLDCQQRSEAVSIESATRSR
jgi:DnaK suppressor protein